MNNEELEKRLVDETSLFERHLGVAPLSKYFWYTVVKRDPLTDNYYTWEIQWCAADPEPGWRCIGSFEEAVRFIDGSRR